MQSVIPNTIEQPQVGTKKKYTYRQQQVLFTAALLLADAITILLAFQLAFLIRFQFNLSIFKMDVVPNSSYYQQLSLVLVPVWLLLFWVHGLYDWNNLLGGLKEYSSILQASVMGAISLAVVQFFSEHLVLARGWVGMAWLLIFILTTAERFSMRRLGYTLRRRGYLTLPALLIGAGGDGTLLGEQLQMWPTSGLQLLGYLDDHLPLGAQVTEKLSVVGHLQALDQITEEQYVRELILVNGALTHEQVMTIFQRYGTRPDMRLRLSSGLFDLLTTGLNVKEMGNVPLIGVNRVRLTQVETLVKRTMDIVLSSLALILLSPALLLVAILVKRDSPGPAFYRRRVMGINGTQFDALKFRTMRVDGDAILDANPELKKEWLETQKLKNDPRITKLGSILRKTSIDELPQLINVLKGEMSLIGPRMICPMEMKNYGQWGMNLLTVRPGLSGLWQVSGRSDVSYEERVRLDMLYIRNYSLWLDLQMILQTIPAVLMRRGAY